MTRSKGKPSKEALAITTGKTLAHKKKKNGASSKKKGVKGSLSSTDMKNNRAKIRKRLKNVSKTAAKGASSRVKKMFRGKPGHTKAKTVGEALDSLALTYNRMLFGCKMLNRNRDPAFLLKDNKPNHRAIYFP